MRIEPTSCSKVGARRQLVDMDQRFQPFERAFNLPPEPVCGEDLVGRVVLGRQRRAKDQKFCGGQRTRIERLLLAAGLGVQRLWACGVLRVASTASGGLRRMMRRIGIITPRRTVA